MDSQASEYVSLAVKAASISSRFTVPVRGDQCGSVQKHSWQPSVGCFSRNEDKFQILGCKKYWVQIQTILDQVLEDDTLCCLSDLCLADQLQVHAIYEVIWLLGGEGSRLLQLVTNKSETTANHQQQQSGDDQAECQRKDGAWLWDWMSSHYWKWFRDGGVTFCLALWDFGSN